MTVIQPITVICSCDITAWGADDSGGGGGQDDVKTQKKTNTCIHTTYFHICTHTVYK